VGRFSNLNVTQKLSLLVGIFLVGFSAFALLAQRTLDHVEVNGPLYRDIVRSKDIVADVLPPPEYIIESYLVVLEMTHERDPAVLKKLIDRVEALHKEYGVRHTFWTKEPLSPEMRDALLVRSYRPALGFFEVWEQEFVPAALAGDSARMNALATGKLRVLYEEHRRGVDDVVTLATKDTVDYESAARVEIQQANRWLFGLAALILASSLAVATMIGRSLVARLRASSVSLMSTATQISATSKHQQTAVNNYSASSSQIAAAVKEISATSQELRSTLADVNQTAARSASLAENGREGLRDMDATMRQLADATSSISGKLSVIREKANDINLAVTTITKVADQTNLLSVNAAIEAEKAGEYGLGFLVVAREIRRLADQSAVATLDIDQMVRQMQAAVSSGVMEMDKFSEEVRRGVGTVEQTGGHLSQIIEQVQSLSSRIDAVNEGMQAQAQGATQISDAMAHLTDDARQTAASLSEFNSATDGLRDVVSDLRRELTNAPA
jgi:methyl-accepting chemotaxis protein WspA